MVLTIAQLNIQNGNQGKIRERFIQLFIIKYKNSHTN
jgi:hypothetical protein